jgi:hypothetical protein
MARGRVTAQSASSAATVQLAMSEGCCRGRVLSRQRPVAAATMDLVRWLWWW